MEQLDTELGYERTTLEILASHVLPAGVVKPDLVQLDSRRRGAVVGGRVSIMVGDTVGGEKAAKLLLSLSALTFLTCFKVLDVIVETILDENYRAGTLREKPSWRFEEKRMAVRAKELAMPLGLAARPWATERTLALYNNLVPFRNEVVHQHSYKVGDERLQVVDSTSGGTRVLNLSILQLGALARFALGICTYFSRPADEDQHGESLMRYYADLLVDVHGLPVFGQREPVLTRVEVTVEETDGLFSVDLGWIRTELRRIHPGRDMLFGLKVIGMERYARSRLDPPH